MTTTPAWRAEPIHKAEFWRAAPPQALLKLCGPAQMQYARRRLLPLQHLFVPADDPWPLLPRQRLDWVPGRSAARWASDDRHEEEQVRCAGLTLGLARLLMNRTDAYEYCRHAGCFRAERCIASRRAFPGPAWPACIDTPLELAPVQDKVGMLMQLLGAGIAGRLTQLVGQPWSAADHIGLTALPQDALQDVMEET